MAWPNKSEVGREPIVHGRSYASVNRGVKRSTVKVSTGVGEKRGSACSYIGWRHRDYGHSRYDRHFVGITRHRPNALSWISCYSNNTESVGLRKMSTIKAHLSAITVTNIFQSYCDSNSMLCLLIVPGNMQYIIFPWHYVIFSQSQARISRYIKRLWCAYFQSVS